MATLRVHVPEIDVLKGFCILCVLCIHAQLFADTSLFIFLINRAVPIFLVLFGLTSELWWQKSSEQRDNSARRRWYLGRLKRVLPAYWAMMAGWWLVVALWQRPDDAMTLGWPQVVISFLGSAGWVGTTWFVTILLQYIALMPALRRVLRGRWAVAVLGVAALSTWATAVFMLDVIGVCEALFGNNVQELYYYWVSFPRALWHVVAGMFIARCWQGRVGLTATGLSIAIAVGGALFVSWTWPRSWDLEGRMQQVALLHLLDVPLAIALLGLARWLPLPALARRVLAWCGRWSWGIYLAHLLLHESLRIAQFDPGFYPQSVRAVYALILFVFGTALAVGAQRTVRLLAALRSASARGGRAAAHSALPTSGAS